MAPAPPPTGILDLPLEILLQIASYLSFEDHGAARTACRHLDAALLEPYALRYLSRMQFMRMDFSLQTLVDMSRSRMSPYVRRVAVSMEQFLAPGFSGAPNYSAHYHRQADLLRSGRDLDMLTRAFARLGHLDQVAVHSYYTFQSTRPWTSHGARRLLRETGVDLSREKPPPDFQGILSGFVPALLHAVGSARERAEAEAEAEGGAAAGAADGAHHAGPRGVDGADTHGDEELSSSSPPSWAPGGAAAVVVPPPLRGFEVALASGALPDTAFDIPPHMRSAVVPVLAGLESLALPVKFADRTPGLRPLPAENPNDSTYHLRRFLRLVDGEGGGGGRLRRLCLTVFQVYHEETEAFFGWLGAPAAGFYSGAGAVNGAGGGGPGPAGGGAVAGGGFSPPGVTPRRQSLLGGRGRAAPPPVYFGALEELELARLHVTRQRLAGVVDKFAGTLRRLRLRGVTLYDERLLDRRRRGPHHHHHHQQMQNGNGNGNGNGAGDLPPRTDEPWAVLWEHLVEVGCGETLERLEVEDPAQQDGATGSRTQAMGFLRADGKSERRFEHEGPGMREALEDLGTRIVRHNFVRAADG